MPTKITSVILEGFLNCNLKGHLKALGETGAASEFEKMLLARRAKARLRLIEKLLAIQPANSVERDVLLTLATLKRGSRFILDAVLDDDRFSLHFDGLQRTDGTSKLGRFHYVPLLIHDSHQIRREQKLLLALYGLALSELQGKPRVRLDRALLGRTGP